MNIQKFRHPIAATPNRKLSWLLAGFALLFVLFSGAPRVWAHNLDTRATSIAYAKDYLQTLSTRAGLNQQLVQVGDEFWMVVKTTPGPGTNTGVGGYQTFYVPPGFQVVDAASVTPNAADPRGFITIPMKGQSPIAIGSGPIGAKVATGLTGFTYPSPNILGVNQAPVTAGGLARGTVSGVYADTGIFYSTDARTAFNSYGAAISGGAPPMKNNSGDTVGEWDAVNIAGNDILGVMTLWDSYQLRAFGRSDVAPIIDTADGRGNSPWGMGSAVAGPESGYRWSYNHAAYTNTASIPGTIQTGPWNRVKYPGSQVSNDQAGLVSSTIGYTGVDASSIGYNFAASGPLPTTVNAVRFAIGQLQIGRPEYSAVKFKVNSVAALATTKVYADAFGGDAGGTDNGKDHLWRYFDPTVVTLSLGTSLQKVASNDLIPLNGQTSFTITFANLGTVALPNVVLTDLLPSGLTYVGASPVPNTNSGGVQTWNLGTVNPNQIRTITLFVKGTSVGIHLNTVVATSNGTEITRTYETVEVGSRPELRKDKTVTPSTVAPGGAVTYTVNVYNDGTAGSATPMVITDYLPPGFTYTSFVSATINGAATTPTINSADATKPVFTFNQSIQAGKTLTFKFVSTTSVAITAGTYYNETQVSSGSILLPPIPEAPVVVGGARIGDFIWRDWDGDGVQDSGEEGISGLTVQLFASNGTTLLQTTTTDANGMYLFTGLNAATYVVKVTPPASHTQTFDPDVTVNNQTTVVLATDQQFLTADFGYGPTGSGSIGDQVFEDINKNGTWNAGEPGIPNVTVNLYEDTNGNGVINAGDLLIATQVTNGSGIYNFTGLNTTRNYIAAVNTADADIGSYFTTLYGSSAAQITTSNRYAIAAGFTTVTTADFGYWRSLPATIGDQVFADNNFNGIFDAGDAPLSNITVGLYDSTGTVLLTTLTTNASGIYTFTGLAAGTYVVKADGADPDVPAGYSASVTQRTATVAAGDNFLTADFPFIAVFNKAVDLDAAAPADFLNYTMYPYWPGPNLLTDAKVTDAVPAGTTFVSASQGGVKGLAPISSTPGVPGSHSGSPGSGSVALTAVKDTSIDSANPTFNYGVSTSLTENRGGGDTLGSQQILVQFDLASVPAGATITGAQFKLTKTDTTNSASSFQIYPLLKSWSEGTGNGAAGAASFNLRSTGTAWTGASTAFDKVAPSADFGGLLAQTTVNGAGTYTWSDTALLSQVQSWYSTPANNFGLVLGSSAGGTDDTTWNSRESAGTKPQLVVDYTAAATPSTTTAITTSSSSVSDTGAGVNVTVSMTVTATGAVTNVTPSALTVIPGANGATATFVSGPTNSPANIPANGSAVFTWVYKVFAGTQPDQVRFSGTATGTGATFGGATSNGVVVTTPSPSDNIVTWSLGTNTAAVNGSNSGSSPVVGSASLTAVADNEIYSKAPDDNTNYGTIDEMWIEKANDYRNRLLIRFDLSTIPSNATISSSVMRLTRESGNNNNPNIAAHRLNSAWGETTSTWNNRLTGTAWSAAGAEGNYNATAEATVSVTANDPYDWTLTSLTQSWVNGTFVNNGVIMRLPNEVTNGEHRFYTREHATATNRPLLTVNYTTPGTPATTTAMSVLPALITDTGAGVNVTVTQTVTSVGAVTNITPTALTVVNGANGASATYVSGPTGSPASIGAGGGTATFTWVYKVTAGTLPNQVRFTGGATGTGATFATATSNGIIVTAPLTMQVQVISPTPGVPLVNNIAQFYNGPNFLAEDNAITSLTGSIGDFVWQDGDGDGVQDAGEPGISGVTLYIDADNDGIKDVGEVTAVTDFAGAYRFFDLAAGTYTVRYDYSTVPSGDTPTTATSVTHTLTVGEQYNLADFGLAPKASSPGSIGDTLWIDANEDGIFDLDEVPLADITVQLYFDANNNGAIDLGELLVNTLSTDSNGQYNFGGLNAGNYLVRVDSADLDFPVGLTLVSGGANGNGLQDVTLTTGQVYTAADFGYNYSGQIGDTVFYDPNLNGIQNVGELGIAGVTIVLYRDLDSSGGVSLGDTVIQTTFSDSNGNYLFDNLPPGEYVVKVDEQTIQSTPTSGIYGTMLGTTGSSKAVELISPGSLVNLDADFGFVEAAEIEGIVFHDVNHSGVYDGGETPLQPVTVWVYGPGVDGIIGTVDDFANLIATTTTDVNGGYDFLLPPGSYRVLYDTADPQAQASVLTGVTTTLEYLLSVSAGQELSGLDFGRDHPGSVGDTVFADANGNGTKDVSELGLAGITVRLYSDAAFTNLIDVMATDANGLYLFAGLPDGTYYVQVDTATLPLNYNTTPTADPDVTLDSKGTAVLTGGGSVLTMDFGYRYIPPTFAVSGTVYHDNGTGGATAGDSNQSGGEPGLAGVTVKAFVDTNNDTITDLTLTTTTDGSGNYSFIGILQNSNVVVQVQTNTLPSAGFGQTEDPDIVRDHKITIIGLNANVANLDFGYREVLASLSGTIVRSADGDGLAEAGETAVSGVTVSLRYAGPDGIPGNTDDVVQNTVTDVNGDYSFTGLLPGFYQITKTNPIGYYSQADRDGGNADVIDLTIASGNPLTGVADNKVDQDFEITSASFGDYVWMDMDGDGVQDATEPPLAGVRVYVDSIANGIYDIGEPTAITDAAGAYTISGLAPGTYTARVTNLPVGATATYDLDGIGTLNTAAVTLVANQVLTTVDWGYQGDASIGDYIWNDADGDGVQDANESPISGVKVFIDLDADGVLDANEPFSTTNASGIYTMGGLLPGSYTVAIDPATRPAGTTVTGDPDATKDGKTTVTLIAGQTLTTADFGLQGNASVGDYVWNDANGDGLQGATELPLSGVRVFIDLDADGVFDANELFATTNASGIYTIGGLTAGTYTVAVDTTTLPAGVTQTGDPDGTVNNKTTVNLIAGQSLVTADFGYQGNASVGDYIWNDANGDGVQDVGELPLSGVRVFIDRDADGVLDANEPFATTNALGFYTITGLTPGTYTVVLDPTTIPSGSIVTGDPDATLDGVTTVTLSAGQSFTTADFGLQSNTSIGNYVWIDANGDGVQDLTELPLSGVRVYIDADGNDTYNVGETTATTNASGLYTINGLPAATYQVRVDTTTLPAGMAQTYDLDGTGTAHETTVILAGNEVRTDVDFGYQGNASIGDYIWNDADGDGLQDVNELPLSGVVVFIDRDADGLRDANEPFATTNSIGVYSISGLAPGIYTVAVDTTTLPAGATQTGDPDATVNNETTVTLSAGQTFTTADFGYQGDASVGDYVWNDANGDGTQGATELPLSGVKVFIDLDADGVLDANEPFATTNSSGAYTIGGLIPGTYTVVLDPATKPAGTTVTGDPDATKDGKTTVTLIAGQTLTTADFGLQGNASVGDYVWNDANGDGLQGATELPLSAVRVFIDLDADGVLDANEPFAITSSTGAYTISGLTAGTYTVAVDTATLPAGVTQTGDPDATVNNKTTVTLSAGQTFTTADFGYQGNASVGDYVWNDANGNGLQGATELPLSGVKVFIDLDADGVLDANEPFATTNSSGAYTIGGLIPGTYTVVLDPATKPAGTSVTGDPDATKDGKTTVTLIAGQILTTADFGLQGNASVGDYVWNDVDGDGVQDANEFPLSGVVVFIDLDGDGVLDTNEPFATTNSSGAYSISGLTAGTYTVAVATTTLPAGVTQTGDPDATVNNKTTVTLIAGQTYTTADFGYQGNSVIGDFVFNDVNANGQQDGGELGLAGVLVTLKNGSGNDIDSDPLTVGVQPTTQITSAGGAYSFIGLLPGSYRVSFGTLAGYNRTLADQGLDASDSDANVSTGLTTTFALAAGVAINTIDAGYYAQSSITGFVRIDNDGNTTGDVPQSGVTVTLLDGSNNVIATTTTGVDGSYNFPNVPPGSYSIVQSVPSGFIAVSDTDGGNFTAISPVTVIPGTVLTDQDFVNSQFASIAGNVFNDLDRLTDNTVNGTGTNAGGIHINLVNPTGNLVIASIPVAANGTYSFTQANGVDINSNYLLVLSPTVQTVGNVLTTSTLPTPWLSTGENLGAGVGSDGTPNGILAVSTTVGALTQANFGIVQVPDVTPVITAQPNVMNGPTDFNIRVQVSELNAVNTEGLIVVRIPKDTRWNLREVYNPALTSLDGVPMENNKWAYTENATQHIFTTINPSIVIPSGGFSYFGIKARWVSVNQEGIYTISAQIDSGSGNENRINNNSDAEKVDFFNK